MVTWIQNSNYSMHKVISNMENEALMIQILLYDTQEKSIIILKFRCLKILTEKPLNLYRTFLP